MKTLKTFGVFIFSFLVYHIIFSRFFPVDENNVLQAPDWYSIVGIVISVVVSVLFIKKPFRKRRPSFLSKKQRDLPIEPVINSSTVHAVPTETKKAATIETTDELLPAAIDTMLETGEASVLMLQRRLKIGYSRAARLLDIMEMNGIVSGFCGSAPREVLISKHSLENTKNEMQGNLDKSIQEKLVSNDSFVRFGGIDAALLSVDLMSGSDFENYCAGILRRIGYYDVTVTPASGDQGVDIIATKDSVKYAIQCKCYSSDLGNTPVQEVLAGKQFYDCHVGVVLTNRFFTSGAKALATKVGVLLWDRDTLTNMINAAGI